METVTSCPYDLPAKLRMRTVQSADRLIVVSFSLDRIANLTRSELEVARLAHAGLSNEAIAGMQGKSRHTVARQVSSVLRKLRIGSRLALATIPEVRL